MKKQLSLTLLALIVSFASFAIYPIMGSPGCCTGSSSYLFDSTIGGTWSSSNVAIATVGSSSGIVSGVSAGVATITYTVGASWVTYGFTVSPTPAPIVGGSVTLCVGSTSLLTDATPGGIWASLTPAVCSIGSGTGVVTALATGLAQFSYTTGAGCAVYTNDTVTSTTSVAAISGPSTVCLGSVITLTDPTSGGTWSSSTTSVATVSGTGMVSPVALGVTTISYSVTGICGTGTATRTVTVTATTSPGTISGASTVVAGSNITLTDPVTGGSWTSSSTSIATVGASTGIVTGVAAGTVTITYSVTGCSGPAYTTKTVTVTAAPPVNRISGHVLFTGVPVDTTGYLKVWLIHFNPGTGMLTAIDSIVSPAYGPSVYYEFLSTTTDSFRVKAAYFPPTFSSTGYIPTYHTTAFYWHSASVIYHVAPSADDNKDITMAYGTVTAGPGFIAGDVTMGANKGTATDAPAANMLMYVLNGAGTVLQQTYTDAAGHYSFSDLPLGTYTIYPEAINYTTTSYTGITLTSTSSTMNSASFGQHNTPKTIRPKNVGIQNVAPSTTSVITFPNPTSNTLNIQWNAIATEKGTITIADVTGRAIVTSNVEMNQGNGSSQIDLGGLSDGIYTFSLKSASIYYNNKVQVKH